MTTLRSAFVGASAHPRASTVVRTGLYVTLLASCASGCIEGLLVEDLRGAVTLLDGQAPIEEDAGTGEPEQDAAGEPGPVDAGSTPPPPLDAGSTPLPGPDAGRDAGRDGGGSVSDAGGSQDAGCEGGRCDAGEPVLGPCAACGPATLVGPSVTTDFAGTCSNGGPQVCWSNPDGSCSMQCPSTESCTKDDLDACGPGRYCYFARSDCGASSPGFCAPAPNECMANLIARVCGCDGRVYQNLCFATRDGGTAAYLGTPDEHCK